MVTHLAASGERLPGCLYKDQPRSPICRYEAEDEQRLGREDGSARWRILLVTALFSVCRSLSYFGVGEGYWIVARHGVLVFRLRWCE